MHWNSVGIGISDWSVFGGNPAPGNPGAIEQQAAMLRTHAFVEASCAGQLTGLSQRAPHVWRNSPGAQAFGRAVVAPNLSLNGTHHLLFEGAAALENFADVLRDLQAKAADTLTTASQAQLRMSQALDAIHHLQASLVNPINLISPFGDGVAGVLSQMQEKFTELKLGADLLTAAKNIAVGIRAAFELATDISTSSLAVTAVELAGWRTGRSFGPAGTPPTGAMYSSTVWRTYLEGEAATAPTIPANPQAAAAWWADLDGVLQQDYERLYPSTIGNANGLPADVRDRANRARLATDVAGARRLCAAAGTPLPDADVDPAGAARSRITASLSLVGLSTNQIKAVEGSMEVDYQLRRAVGVDQGLPGPVLQLLIYDPGAFDGAGRTAISIGDAATAANVVMTVPGMTSDVPNYLGTQMSDAGALYRAAASQASTAVIAYIGYRAPGLDVSGTNEQLADRGAKYIAADLAGLEAMQLAAAHTTVVAHSYGSTTVATAFAQDGARADDLILIGSPGAGRAKNAKQLNMPAGHVWVGANSADPVTTIAQQAQDPAQLGKLENGAAHRYLGKEWVEGLLVFNASGLGSTAAQLQRGLRPELGPDPAGAGYGAKRFHAENGSTDKYDLDNHSEYFKEGSESLDAMGSIVVGNGASVPLAQGRPETNGHYQGRDPESGDH